MRAFDKNITLMTSEFPPLPGGIGDHAYNLALQLSKNGYVVKVIADQRSNDGNEEQELDATLPFEVKRVKLTHFRLFMYFNRFWMLFRTIKNTKHVLATGKFSLWSVALCSIFLKRNYLAIIHGTEVNFKKPFLRKAVNASLKRFNTIIAVSNYTKYLVAKLNLEVKVIPNGFNIDKWQPNLEITEHLEGHPKLTTVGNVTERKGQKNLIKQLPRLIQKYPNLKYHCVGLKTESKAFMQLAKDLNVEKNLMFHGRKSNEDLQQMLMQSDIFIMLSSETASGDVEGFGIAILEANSLGVPAIGSLGCGIVDAIDPDNSGVLIQPSDGEALENAIAVILKDPEHFRKKAIAWAEKHRWSDVIQMYLPYLT